MIVQRSQKCAAEHIQLALSNGAGFVRMLTNTESSPRFAVREHAAA
ncbi:hypothetical protein [Pseudonocardia yunnanensis]|uniref:Uncharacterized protein n=1 Tax=Pseudonocardia yunnanensis TaxID=58107 RepID=A0ABW4EYP5_9PSEU